MQAKCFSFWLSKSLQVNEGMPWNISLPTDSPMALVNARVPTSNCGESSAVKVDIQVVRTTMVATGWRYSRSHSATWWYIAVAGVSTWRDSSSSPWWPSRSGVTWRKIWGLYRRWARPHTYHLTLTWYSYTAPSWLRVHRLWHCYWRWYTAV